MNTEAPFPSKLPNQASLAFIPSDAQNVRHLPYEQTRYVLPKNNERLYPIHVFVGGDVHQKSVDQWYENIVDFYMNCTDPFIYILHDMRSPKVHFTSYVTTKIRALTNVRPELEGATALLFQKQQTFTSNLFQGILSSLPLPRSTRMFYDYDSAMRWLTTKMR